jgi:MFS family permease
MAAGRLVGDRLTAALGRPRLAGGGALLAAAGLAIAVGSEQPAAGVAGFAAMGAGLATAFPLVVSAAANRPETASGAAIAAVTTTGYSGFMVGPPAIGFVAEATSLRVALALPIALCLIAAAMAPALTGRGTGQPAS